MRADSVIRKALKAFRKEEIPREIPQSLPLLDALRKRLPIRQDFANVEALFIQHHLGPLVPRIRSMIHDGLHPERCWFVDIPYSTNTRVRRALRILGCPRSQMAEPFDDPLEPYSESQVERVQRVVRRLADTEGRRRLLVVDDGAYFLRSIQNLPKRDQVGLIKSLKNRTHLVEQTTRGHRHLEEKAVMKILYALGAPVVTIARSFTKQYLESPFIGVAVARAVVSSLKKRNEREPASILVIGFGAVGEATTHELRRFTHRSEIDVLEINPEKSEAIRAAGALALTDFPSSGSYDLVMGCTGYASFPLEKRSLLANGALLGSGSSAAIELNRERFVELADKLPDDEIRIMNRNATKKAGIHATIRLEDQDRSFSFLNAGFPVNFDGALECIPARFIQPTHGLLFAACQQTLRSQMPGLSFLSFSDDFWIYKQGLKLIGNGTV